MNFITEETNIPLFDKIIKAFQPLYPNNPCVIAGGAVRDYLMGHTPKDIDVYFLGLDWTKEDGAGFEKKISASQIHYELATSNLPWHTYERYLLLTIIWQECRELQGIEVQFMGFPVNNIEDLLKTFDWEICIYGYQPGKLTTTKRAMFLIDKIQGYDPKDERYRPPHMMLCNVQFPISNLRRGFKFEARYPIKLHYPHILKLCKAVIEEHKRDKNMDRGEKG